MSCGVGHRRGSDPVWLWRRPVATAPIGPLAWEPSYAAGAAQEIAKRPKKKKKLHVMIYVLKGKKQSKSTVTLQNGKTRLGEAPWF